MALVYSRALDLVPPPDGPGGKLGDPGDLCLASCAVSPWDWGLQTCPLSLFPGCLSVVSVVIFF